MFCPLTKEHKHCAYGLIGIILIVIIVSCAFRFWERRESKFGMQGRGMYERMGKRGSDYEGNRFQNDSRSCGMMGGGQGNKIALPANSISQTDASKVVLNANSWAKVLQAFLENNAWATAYVFILNNNTEVRVDAVTGKIISAPQNTKIGTNTGTTTTK